MDKLIGKSKASRRLVRNLIAGLCGFAVAFAFLLVVLRVQDYLPAWFVKLLLFVFPLPVACGLAVGLLSPRRAIAWAPLWSGIFALMLLALLSGGIDSFGVALSAGRIGCIFAGAALAAAAGLAGQWAAHNGRAVLSTVVLVVVCGALVPVGYGLFVNDLRVYERNVKPTLLVDVDTDYIALPWDMEWTCERRVESGTYVLQSTLNGQPIYLHASASNMSLANVEYSVPGTGEDLTNEQDVRIYVKKYGLRDAFLVGLSELNAPRRCWRSVLRGSRLTVWRDGQMTIDALPIDLESPRKPLGRSSDLR